MYAKFSNGIIVPIDDNGFITLTVDVELGEIIAFNHEGLMDLLSERATGTSLLSDISYTIVGHGDTSISLQVTGIISEMCDGDVETVDGSDLPDLAWKVNICRQGIGFDMVSVTAKTEAEAKDKADELAGDIVFSDSSSVYSFEATAAK